MHSFFNTKVTLVPKAHNHSDLRQGVSMIVGSGDENVPKFVIGYLLLETNMIAQYYITNKGARQGTIHAQSYICAE